MDMEAPLDSDTLGITCSFFPVRQRTSVSCVSSQWRDSVVSDPGWERALAFERGRPVLVKAFGALKAHTAHVRSLVQRIHDMQMRNVFGGLLNAARGQREPTPEQEERGVAHRQQQLLRLTFGGIRRDIAEAQEDRLRNNVETFQATCRSQILARRMAQLVEPLVASSAVPTSAADLLRSAMRTLRSQLRARRATSSWSRLVSASVASGGVASSG